MQALHAPRCARHASGRSGRLILAALLFFVFQAVFSWAAVPMDLIDAGVARLGAQVAAADCRTALLRSLLVDGVIAGVGSVLVFLPQILILFLFILALEDSGYLPRAAYLLDRLMGSVGLSGRAFIPLLSSFACADSRHHGDAHDPEPARPARDDHDRAADDLLGAPARVRARDRGLHPERRGRAVQPAGPGAVRAVRRGHPGRDGSSRSSLKRTAMRSSYHPLLLELPEYHWPHLNNLLIGLWERTKIFVQRVGTIILALMIVLWFLSSYPAPPPDATGPGDLSTASRA